MAKIMVVEDDQSLREIYSIRLTAEGYEVVSAGDGEEALAIAVKERPDLVLSDVMMPKISGFDMLDILRSTPETKNIKVIMMTALSSDDQRKRGENLGADKYLVKSQVGIEDVIAAVHEVLGGAAGAPMPDLPPAPNIPADQQMPVPTPKIVDEAGAVTPPSSTTPEVPVAPVAVPNQPVSAAPATAPVPPAPVATVEAPVAPVAVPNQPVSAAPATAPVPPAPVAPQGDPNAQQPTQPAAPAQ